MSMMSHEPEKLDVVLAAAVGNDAALMAELRGAFVSGAAAHVAAIARGGDVGARQTAAWRLHGLAASFGATGLMDLAEEAARLGGPDPRLIARLHRAVDDLAG